MRQHSAVLELHDERAVRTIAGRFRTTNESHAMIGRVLILVLLLPAVAACGSKKEKSDQIAWGQMRDVFPPVVGALPPPPDAASLPAPQSDASAQEDTNPVPADRTTWPLTVRAEGVTFQVHEPLLDAWHDDRLAAHALVLAQPAGQQQTVPGAVVMTAQTQVDRAAGVVALRQLQVTDASFQGATPKTAGWSSLLRVALPEEIKTVPLAGLEAGQGAVRARQRAAAASSVAAPRIVIAEKPAVLVYIDGEPSYVPLQGTKLLGVANTRVLLLKDPSGRHYLRLYNGWVSAASLQGPWSVKSPPAGAAKLEEAARATGRVNLLSGKPDAKGRSPTLSQDKLPQIIVSTKPAALIVLDGAPRFAQIPGTALEYAANTSAHLFRDGQSKNLYVRAGGYWFRADSLAGPWQHVPVATLPAAFSAIPDDSPKRRVKASIAAVQDPEQATTARAPAVVAADRSTARLSLTLSGDPVLKPIPGTELNYVANASAPVIQVDINNWYAVQSGVWFHASEATGPWTVTDSVPPEFDTIPPTVPIYSAIHSRVLSSSSDVIYYGYPGEGSLAPEGGAVGVEDQGADYQYTPPSSLHWGWFY